MAFPWICFKCGSNENSKEALIEHIVAADHRLTEAEQQELVDATIDVSHALKGGK